EDARAEEHRRVAAQMARLERIAARGAGAARASKLVARRARDLVHRLADAFRLLERSLEQRLADEREALVDRRGAERREELLDVLLNLQRKSRTEDDVVEKRLIDVHELAVRVLDQRLQVRSLRDRRRRERLTVAQHGGLGEQTRIVRSRGDVLDLE